MLRVKLPGAIIIGAVVVASWLVLKPANEPPVGAVPPSPVVARLDSARQVNPPVIDNQALETLQATIAGLLQRMEVLEAEKTGDQPAAASPSLAAVGQKSAAPAFQTQILYFGSGSTTQRDWTETGAQAWLDSNSYPAGVNVSFEAGLSIIGGEAWARLKNKTTGAIISVSEVWHNNSSVTWKSSPQFKLHPGNNLYVVELKSSSDEMANLSGSRVQLSQ